MLRFCKINRDVGIVRADCVVIDGMCVVNQLTKPDWVKTGKELNLRFCKKVEIIAKESLTIILDFDTYLDRSLKEDTRVKRKAGKVPRQYDTNETTLLSKLTLSDILAHDKTKLSLTKYRASKKYFSEKKEVNCIVAGSGEVSMGIENYQNNHEEADTLLIHCISIVELSTQVVSVYAADTDVFALLLRHLDKMKCHRLYMQINTNEYIDMTSVAELLGNKVCSTLISFFQWKILWKNKRILG